MTRKEHENKAKALKAKATRLRNQSKTCLKLADKVALQRQAKAVDEKRAQHMLNFYQLVSNP